MQGLFTLRLKVRDRAPFICTSVHFQGWHSGRKGLQEFCDGDWVMSGQMVRVLLMRNRCRPCDRQPCEKWQAVTSDRKTRLNTNDGRSRIVLKLPVYVVFDCTLPRNRQANGIFKHREWEEWAGVIIPLTSPIRSDHILGLGCKISMPISGINRARTKQNR